MRFSGVHRWICMTPLALLVLTSNANGVENSILTDLKGKAEEKCLKYSLPQVLCVEIYNKTVGAALDTASSDTESFASKAGGVLTKDSIQSPEVPKEVVLNSALIGSRLDSSPLSLSFKMIDRENADSVLGLEFGYQKDFSKSYLKSSDTMRHYYDFEINVDGTVTQDSAENPRNFIKATIGLVGGMHTKVPTQTGEIKDRANLMIQPENINNKEMADQFDALVDGITQPLGGFTFVKYGVNAGYETDQEFKAKNQTMSAFAFAQYESWDKSSFLGGTGVIPSIRFSIDQVDPNSDTPRAIVGDDSTYSRVSGEVSLWMPLGQFFSKAVALTFNYQTYQELSASSVVKSAGLDSYQLRTYSLTAPSGLYFSYSSGRLPFGLQDQQTVELGFKNYF